MNKVMFHSHGSQAHNGSSLTFGSTYKLHRLRIESFVNVYDHIFRTEAVTGVLCLQLNIENVSGMSEMSDLRQSGRPEVIFVETQHFLLWLLIYRQHNGLATCLSAWVATLWEWLANSLPRNKSARRVVKT
jgi:hypothetical protein